MVRVSGTPDERQRIVRRMFAKHPGEALRHVDCPRDLMMACPERADDIRANPMLVLYSLEDPAWVRELDLKIRAHEVPIRVVKLLEMIKGRSLDEPLLAWAAETVGWFSSGRHLRAIGLGNTTRAPNVIGIMHTKGSKAVNSLINRLASARRFALRMALGYRKNKRELAELIRISEALTKGSDALPVHIETRVMDHVRVKYRLLLCASQLVCNDVGAGCFVTLAHHCFTESRFGYPRDIEEHVLLMEKAERRLWDYLLGRVAWFEAARKKKKRRTRMWFLFLNPMRGACEARTQVAYAGTANRELLEAFVKEHLAPEPYQDGQWLKVFKRGSPLEWYNAPDTDSYRMEPMKYLLVDGQQNWDL